MMTRPSARRRYYVSQYGCTHPYAEPLTLGQARRDMRDDATEALATAHRRGYRAFIAAPSRDSRIVYLGSRRIDHRYCEIWAAFTVRAF